MFLMKIRLNLFDEDIAYRFSVHHTTVSRNFHKVLDVMAARTVQIGKHYKKLFQQLLGGFSRSAV